ncbi:RNA-directed DNA polymerase from mobile element jockey [Plakobranchus ocellatus]|uniref:RNA-directed DNA polymerase from mobile element jockey n=1 Tax=Plakobranchus ocellatus TaxID=259542 RepID=A0AAV3ZVX8_9GAST|nr:RNA-directed DNA polymerase from mobile element jockey [Plakobranchus ocellatus]
MEREVKWKNITNGMPQGGGLSPTLSLIYINDMKEQQARKVYPALYADDLALISTEEVVGIAKVCLQTRLYGITRRIDEYKLKINANKTTYTIVSLSTKKKKGQIVNEGHTLEKNNLTAHHMSI